MDDVYDRLRELAAKLADDNARQEVLRLIRKLEFERDSTLVLRAVRAQESTVLEWPTVNSNALSYPITYFEFDYLERPAVISVFVPEAFVPAGRPSASFRAEPPIRMRPRGAVRMRRPVRSRPGWCRRRRDSAAKAR